MRGEDINRILGITETFQLPEKLLGILFSEDKDRILDEFMDVGEVLSHDWFTEYFEENHANKSKMAQDFTPHAVSDLLSGLIGEADSVADICAGTGGLTIGYWNRYPEASFVCYEISERAIPLLLLNLSIRNIDAKVFRMDILTGEVFESYRLTKAKKYSNIAKEFFDFPKVSAVISNPPYSLKYTANQDESRFGGFAGSIPSNFADFAFVAFALNMTDGRCGFILPHGVLFRSNKEGEIRQKLVEQKKVETIIGLPEKLFLNTGIPTCILIFGSSSDLLFVDGSSECRKAAKLNIMDTEHVDQILDIVHLRTDVKKLSHLATFEELKKNDFNLNIPRYVNSYEPPPPIDLNAVCEDLLDLNKKIDQTSKELAKMMKQLVTEDDQKSEAIAKYIRYLERRKVKEYEPEQIGLDLGLFDSNSDSRKSSAGEDLSGRNDICSGLGDS